MGGRELGCRFSPWGLQPRYEQHRHGVTNIMARCVLAGGRLRSLPKGFLAGWSKDLVSFICSASPVRGSKSHLKLQKALEVLVNLCSPAHPPRCKPATTPGLCTQVSTVSLASPGEGRMFSEPPNVTQVSIVSLDPPGEGGMFSEPPNVQKYGQVNSRSTKSETLGWGLAIWVSVDLPGDH